MTDEDYSYSTGRGRKGYSLFGPLLFIGSGLLLLLSNLNFLPTPNWLLAGQFVVPLVLIGLGVNILVRRLPGIVSTILSGVLGFMVFAVLAFLVFFAGQVPALAQLTENTQVRSHTLTYQDRAATSAEVWLELEGYPTEVTALRNNPNLFSAEISLVGSPQFQAETRNAQARISLQRGAVINNAWFNPFYWWNLFITQTEGDVWFVGLQRDLPTSLTMSYDNGRVDFDLSELTLTNLSVVGGSGPGTLRLPAGDYNTNLTIDSAFFNLYLPEAGVMTLRIAVDSGNLTIYMPDDLPAQFEITRNDSGRFTHNIGMTETESPTSEHAGVWQSRTYTPNGESVVQLYIDIDSGSVTVRSP